MDKLKPTNTDGYLDILGQQPYLSKLYTQITSCYPLPDDAPIAEITNTLTSGLKRLSAAFPWIAGQVVHEAAPEGKGTGVFRFAPLEEIPHFRIKDLRDDPSAMTMEQLREANFPMSMLDESVIAPRNTLTLPGGPDSKGPAPVFLVQATLVRGGLLLTFVAQHNVMDMGGQGAVVALLSKACRGEDFTAEEIEIGNRDRRYTIPLLGEPLSQPSSEVETQPPKPEDSQQPTPSPAESTWAYFTFSPEALASLKSLASESVTTPPGFVSTDDVVTALIWQATSRVRLPRLDPSTPSTLGRAVDVRRRLGLPPTYPGVAQNMNYHTFTIGDLTDSPLGKIASDLRLALVDSGTSGLAYRTRAMATVLDGLADKTTMTPGTKTDPSTDVLLSSWANQKFFEWDFHLGLGMPEAVRRPRFTPFEGLMYLMPRKAGGEIVAGISLSLEDMERLRTDEEFGKYAKYIG